jgi:hypothetical protein
MFSSSSSIDENVLQQTGKVGQVPPSKQRSALGGLTLNTTSGKITSTITSSYPAEIEYCSASSSSSLSSTTTSESTICHELFGSSSSSSSISLKKLRNTGKMMAPSGPTMSSYNLSKEEFEDSTLSSVKLNHVGVKQSQKKQVMNNHIKASSKPSSFVVFEEEEEEVFLDKDPMNGGDNDLVMEKIVPADDNGWNELFEELQ